MELWNFFFLKLTILFRLVSSRRFFTFPYFKEEKNPYFKEEAEVVSLAVLLYEIFSIRPSSAILRKMAMHKVVRIIEHVGIFVLNDPGFAFWLLAECARVVNALAVHIDFDELEAFVNHLDVSGRADCEL